MFLFYYLIFSWSLCDEYHQTQNFCYLGQCSNHIVLNSVWHVVGTQELFVE